MAIENREMLQKSREAFLEQIDRQTKKIYVCGGTGCVAGGSMEIYERLKELIEEKGLNCQVNLEKEEEGKIIKIDPSVVIRDPAEIIDQAEKL